MSASHSDFRVFDVATGLAHTMPRRANEISRDSLRQAKEKIFALRPGRYYMKAPKRRLVGLMQPLSGGSVWLHSLDETVDSFGVPRDMQLLFVGENFPVGQYLSLAAEDLQKAFGDEAIPWLLELIKDRRYPAEKLTTPKQNLEISESDYRSDSRFGLFS